MTRREAFQRGKRASLVQFGWPQRASNLGRPWTNEAEAGVRPEVEHAFDAHDIPHNTDVMESGGSGNEGSYGV